MTRVRRITGQWAILSEATGYSGEYCKKVVRGERSQTSKGGKIIMEKYREFQKLLEPAQN
jgi:hypothetical protein